MLSMMNWATYSPTDRRACALGHRENRTVTQRVLVDANIFFSRTLTDWVFLLRNHTGGMYQVFTTQDAISEAISSFRTKRPMVQGAVTANRARLIRENVDEILDDFPAGLSFTGKDDGDYRIHASAHSGRADFILTSNDPEDIAIVVSRERRSLAHCST